MAESSTETNFRAKPSAEKRGEMSLDEFLRQDWDEQGDGLKYEWCDGFVEAGEENMHPEELTILSRIQRGFVATTHFQNEGAEIHNEMELRSSANNSYRRVDIVGYRGEQIANPDKFTIPPFAIEVISEFDNANHHLKKIQEYFASGVEVFWQISPEIETVFVYAGKQCLICTGDDICSAAPAFPEFELAAKDLFS